MRAIFINNSVNLTNQTILGESGSCFNITNAPPQQPAITYPINGDSIYGLPVSLNATVFDIDNDSITYYYYINGRSIQRQPMVTRL